MTESKLRAADVLARRLAEAGCRHAFGMPGGEVLTLVDALEAAGIRFHSCKHENAAGFMAEGVHHRDGAPAILVATVGPGALNCVNVVANALQDRVPLVALTGCVDADEALTYTHQVLDHQQVFRPLCKVSFRLTADGADTIADKAVAISAAPRMGPVHVDVPISVAEAECAAVARRRRPPASPVAPAGTDIETARSWLDEARKPVAVIGLDALRDGAETELRSFLERRGVPFVTTYKAKGIVPEDHPLCLGAAGLSPLADSHLLPLVRQADLVLAIGYDPIEMRAGWRDAWDTGAQRVIDIAAEQNLHYMHQARLNFVADTGATLLALEAETAFPASGDARESRRVAPAGSQDAATAAGSGAGPAGACPTWPDGEPGAVREALARAFPVDDEWGPAAVFAELRKTMPNGTLLSADSGAHRILASQMWRCDAPREMVQSTGFCTMGCAVPLAMGMKLAEPDRHVVAVCGDAGFLMVAGELATAAELGLAPIFLVLVDASLALIELKQRERGLANAGVDFGRHDLAAAGRALGGAGISVGDRRELRAALEAAMESETFTVIAAQIERGSYDGRI